MSEDGRRKLAEKTSNEELKRETATNIVNRTTEFDELEQGNIYESIQDDIMGKRFQDNMKEIFRHLDSGLSCDVEIGDDIFPLENKIKDEEEYSKISWTEEIPNQLNGEENKSNEFILSLRPVPTKYSTGTNEETRVSLIRDVERNTDVEQISVESIPEAYNYPKDIEINERDDLESKKRKRKHGCSHLISFNNLRLIEGKIKEASLEDIPDNKIGTIPPLEEELEETRAIERIKELLKIASLTRFGKLKKIVDPSNITTGNTFVPPNDNNESMEKMGMTPDPEPPPIPGGGSKIPIPPKYVPGLIVKKPSILKTPKPLDCDPLGKLFNMFFKYKPVSGEVNKYAIEKLYSPDNCSEALLNNYDKLVLILIEERLLLNTTHNLLSSLRTLRDDLKKEGYSPRLVVANVYCGSRHQDGLTLLAIRSFFQEVKKLYNNFTGAILVGSFPEAMLVRTYPRKIVDMKKIALGNVVPGEKKYWDKATVIRICPEIIAERSDIVLSDLTGKWEDCYIEQETQLPGIEAVPYANQPLIPGLKQWPAHGSICFLYKEYNDLTKEIWGGLKFKDFFHINDGKFLIHRFSGTDITVLIIFPDRNLELSSQDKKNIDNPIAIPDIYVSRINAKNIAINPIPQLLDAQGKPQEISPPPGTALISDTIDDIFSTKRWKQDENFELKLIIEYLKRNHEYRKNKGKGTGIVRRAASIRCDPALFCVDYSYIIDSNVTPAIIECNSTLAEYVNWLKKPALFRLISAHSSGEYTLFGKPFLAAPKTDSTLSEIEKAVAYPPFRWVYKNGKLKPSFQLQFAQADWFVHRTLYEAGLSKIFLGTFYIHGGCDANSPENASSQPYSSEIYGQCQNMETILFFANGLSLIARAKDFYDLPGQFFPKILQSGEHYGDVLLGYFLDEKKAYDLDTWQHGIERKRSYWWSIHGDWSLRLNYK